MAELDAVEQALVALEAAFGQATERRDAVDRRQRRLEDELAGVETKIGELERRMYSGSVTIPRELQALSADVDSLKRRRSMLEDDVLEAMTDREPLDQEVTDLGAERERLDAEGVRLRGAVAELQAEIDADLATQEAQRAATASGVPPELTALYEQLRARYGGVGAAPLVGGRCSGCHLSLPATEIDRLKREPPDTLVRCDQCGRILVRP